MFRTDNTYPSPRLLFILPLRRSRRKVSSGVMPFCTVQDHLRSRPWTTLLRIDDFWSTIIRSPDWVPVGVVYLR